MTDIVERLRVHKADIWDWNGHAMKSWDYWRASIAMGDRSSSPRDGFEALIGGYGEDMAEAADTIERLRAALVGLVELVEMQDEFNTPPTDAYVALCIARAALSPLPAPPADDDLTDAREALDEYNTEGGITLDALKKELGGEA